MLTSDIASILCINIPQKICGYKLEWLILSDILFKYVNEKLNITYNYSEKRNEWWLYVISQQSIYLYNWLIDNSIKFNEMQGVYNGALQCGIFELGKLSNVLEYAINSNNIHRVKWFLDNKQFQFNPSISSFIRNIEITELICSRYPNYHNMLDICNAINVGDFVYIEWYYSRYANRIISTKDMGIMAIKTKSLETYIWVYNKINLHNIIDELIEYIFDPEYKIRINYEIIIWFTLNYKEKVLAHTKLNITY